MAIQREFIFVNDKCYNIHGTMSYIENLYHNEGTIVEWRYESIMATLSNFKFQSNVSQDFIEHPYNGVFTPTDLWLIEFGIEEPVAHWVIPIDDPSVGTFSVHSEECIDGEEDEIDAEVEDELILGAMMIMDLVREDAEERNLDMFVLQIDNDGVVEDDWGEEQDGIETE